MLILWMRVNQGAMAMKEYSVFLKALALLGASLSGGGLALL